ncbi:MAG: deoxyribose-phosphate aldolase [Treponema sp.]|nr:deoxyribose-phosphate aldolase [Treponema sp.]
MNVNEIIKETERELGKLLGTGSKTALPTAVLPVSHSGLSLGPSAELRGKGMNLTVPGKLEHSLLDPGISREKINAECKLAAEYRVANVVVSPYYVECAANILGSTDVAVCSAAGFPHGAASQTAKSAELRECIRKGAAEMDVALNVLAIKSGEIDIARRELQEMLQIARGKCLIKAIYEQSLYSDEEKKAVLSLIRDCGCDFVKISNALSGKKAEEADVIFVRSIVGGKVGIKIDGGVKTLQRALELFNSGADRIGLTATIGVAKEALGTG